MPLTPRSGSRPPAGWLQPAVIGAAGIAAYATSFAGVFQFDDYPAILDNPTIRHLWPPLGPLSPPAGALTVSGRPVLNLSLAINYAISGTGVWSYHLFNLLVHLAAAWVLWWVLRRSLGSELTEAAPRRGREISGGDAASTSTSTSTSTLAAVLWVVHPLNTEAVTYVVQRAEALGALFYLLTLACFIRGWRVLSVICCLLAVGTKEIAVSAPLAVLLYDRGFIAGGWREVWRRGKAFYPWLFATWIPLALLVAGSGWDRGKTAGFAVGVPWLPYWISQGEAMGRYLLLAIAPYNLAVDYGPPSWPAAVQAVLALAAVGGALFALVACVRGRRWAYPWAVAVLILAPTSLLPGVLQFVAEHRMYLPLAALITVAVGAARHAIPVRIGVAFAGLFLVATACHNLAYRSDLALWRDAVDHRPQSGLAQANLGYALLTRHRTAEAVPYCEAAVRLDPNKPLGHFNLALAEEELGHRDAALGEFERAAQINPKLTEAEFRAGRILDSQGQPREAERWLRAALAADPDSADAHGSLGVALSAQGRQEEAVAEFERSLALRPRQPEVEFDLGQAWIRRGGAAAAEAHFARAVELRPDYGEAQLNLGVLRARLNRLPEAAAALGAAARLLPNSADAHGNFGAVLDELGRTDEAIAEYRRALQLRPDYPSAQLNLERALRLRRP